MAEDVDLDVVHRIKTEAFQNSQVLDYVFQLTDMNGPRLTGSPGYLTAARSVVTAMQVAGIQDAKVVPWGTFGRSWSHQGVDVRMVTPTQSSLYGIPMAWSRGTEGPVRGSVVLAPLYDDPDDADSNDLEKVAHRIERYREQYAGKLGGKIVLVTPYSSVELQTAGINRRLTGAELDELREAVDPGPTESLQWPLWRFPVDPEKNARLWRTMPNEVDAEYWERELAVTSRFFEFLSEEGVAAVMSVSGGGSGGTIFSHNYGSMHPGTSIAPPTVTLSSKDYNRIVRLVERDVEVQLEVAVDAKFHAESVDGRNVIANIEGGRKAHEVVMMGGHLDSWHGATGATDNASGCAVAMEAMRILRALDVKLDRTVRLALWDGEEQNYYGSRAYVKQHFGDSVTMKLKPDHSRLSAYFNIDGGGGKVRGIFLQSNDMARPIFEAWFAPFADLGVSVVTGRGSFGSDHLVFDSIGLPAFQFVQDPLDYETKTHHSDLDTVDYLDPADLMQAAAVLASVIYHAANREELIPRKPLPKPLPAKRPVPSILNY